MIAKIEHTDTFGGEANYSWVRRYAYEIDSDKKWTRRSLVRRAKSLCGITGIRCNISEYGDMIEIRPIGICQVIFISFE